MEIPNYDSNSNKDNNFIQLHQFMPHDTFRMMICGGGGEGVVKPICFIIC